MVIEKDDKLILLTNDDGLHATGLKTLLEVMEELGKVVLISTIDSMSGMSQAYKPSSFVKRISLSSFSITIYDVFYVQI